MSCTQEEVESQLSGECMASDLATGDTNVAYIGPQPMLCLKDDSS